MAINFPSSPTNGQLFTSSGITWVFNSAKGVWEITVAGTLLAHSHPQSDIINLIADLAAKAALVHAHVATDITDSTAAGRAMLLAANAASQTALLNNFTSALKGLVPLSGGGTANFLRADGTWQPPTGGITRTLLGFANPTSGTTSPIVIGDTNAYDHLEIEINGVGLSGTTLTLAASGDGGANYGGAVTIATADHSGEAYWGFLAIRGHKLPQVGCHCSGAIQCASATAPHVMTATNVVLLKHATGGIGDVDALRLAGGTFNAGSSPEWRVYGVK